MQDPVLGLYDPNALPTHVDLNDLVEPLTAPREAERDLPPPAQDPGRPLTAEEVQRVDLEIDRIRGEVQLTRESLKVTRSRIQEQIAGADISFDVRLKGRPALKRAARKIFGHTPTRITYAMYKEALAALRLLEKQSADEFLESR